MNITNSSAIACVAGALMVVSAAAADFPLVSVSLESSSSTSIFDPAEFGSEWENGNGSFGYDGSYGQAGSSDLGWSMLVASGGQGGLAGGPAFGCVVANFVTTNTSGVTGNFSIIVTLTGVSSGGLSSFVSGSVVGSLTDLNGNGATLQAKAGEFIYTASTDMTNVAGTLIDDSVAFSANAFESATVGPAAFGQDEYTTPIVDQIQIELAFTLSAGDSAAFTSIFCFKPIPAPAGMALLGLAGLVGGRRRRA
jgi:hypothetical protein